MTFKPFPGCRVCENERHNPSWDVHGWGAKIATGDVTGAQVAREVGLTRQAVMFALQNHGLSHVVEQGREASELRRMSLFDQAKARRLAARRRTARVNDWAIGQSSFSDEDSIAALREVYGRVGPGKRGGFSHDDYDAHRKPGQPSAVTLMQRGRPTWREWLEEAGIPSNPPARTNYEKISYQECIGWVARFVADRRSEDVDATCSASTYTAWAKTTEGAPSRATVVKVVGWSTALQAAYDLLYGES